MAENPELVNKDFLIEKGIPKYTAQKLIKRVKDNLASQGYSFYENPRLSVVPIVEIEKLLGYEFNLNEDWEGRAYEKWNNSKCT